MRFLENETNPDILRELVKLSVAEVERLNQVINKIQEEKAKASTQVLNLEDSYSVLKKRFFGKSSEKRSRPKSSEMEELTLHGQTVLPPVNEKKVNKLPVDEVIYKASEEELKSMSSDLGLEQPSQEQWEEVPGMFEESFEITIVERSYRKTKIKKQKYKLKKPFALEEKTQFYTCHGPDKLLPGSTYSIDFAVSVVTDKYVNHLPLERQTRIMESNGLNNIKTNTLYQLCRIVGTHLEPLICRIKDEILSTRLVHGDETPWPITNGKDSSGYMWVLSNNTGSYYQFEPTRSGQVPERNLKNYTGFLMTDGYSGYTRFKDSPSVTLTHCHSHARREFIDIQKDYPEVEFYLKYYDDLFKIEKLASSFDQLKSLRQERSKVIIDKMKIWLDENYLKARGESTLQKAIKYSLKRWKELTLFLEHPEVPLTNNEAERTIRHAVMGRKNFYGSRSIDGADITAVFYTIIESCKKVEADPRIYLLQTVKEIIKGNVPLTPLEYVKSNILQ
jgi:hypothetical protein